MGSSCNNVDKSWHLELKGYGGKDVKKAHCHPYSSSLSVVTLIYLSWLHKHLKPHSGGVHSPIYNGATYSLL